MARRPAGRAGVLLVLQLMFLAGLEERPLQAAPAAGGRSWPAYGEWREACRRLPANRELGTRLAPRDRLPLRSYADFAPALEAFLELSRTGMLAEASAWVDAAPNQDTFFNLDTGYYLRPETPFQPFAQRHVVPPGTRVFLHGDLHGDIHSLLAFLDWLNTEGHLDGFRLARPDLRVVFLGDYTDRGMHGLEVMYTLLRLKVTNPDRVWLVRGNHEDVNLVARYGFLAEVAGKYGNDFDVRRLVRMYDFLPAVLYLASGPNVVQCNHGGLEPGYDPRPLLAAPPDRAYHLLGRLQQRRWLAENRAWVGSLPSAERRQLEAGLADFLPRSPTAPTVLGFLWNDFTVLPGEPQFAVDPDRAFVYGETATRTWLTGASGPEHRVRAIFRGHQHAATLNPLMRRLMASRGVFRHWQPADRAALADAAPEALRDHLEVGPERTVPDGSVWTFNVSPDSIYGAGCGFTFATAGELTSAEAWEDWRLRVLNFQVGRCETSELTRGQAH